MDNSPNHLLTIQTSVNFTSLRTKKEDLLLNVCFFVHTKS